MSGTELEDRIAEVFWWRTASPIMLGGIYQYTPAEMVKHIQSS